MIYVSGITRTGGRPLAQALTHVRLRRYSPLIRLSIRCQCQYRCQMVPAVQLGMPAEQGTTAELDTIVAAWQDTSVAVDWGVPEQCQAMTSVHPWQHWALNLETSCSDLCLHGHQSVDQCCLDYPRSHGQFFAELLASVQSQLR